MSGDRACARRSARSRARLLDLLRMEAKAAHMTEAEWCYASWYVIYPVALLPHLERGSFSYAERERSNKCMQRGMPLWERLGRQAVHMRPGLLLLPRR